MCRGRRRLIAGSMSRPSRGDARAGGGLRGRDDPRGARLLRRRGPAPTRRVVDSAAGSRLPIRRAFYALLGRTWSVGSEVLLHLDAASVLPEAEQVPGRRRADSPQQTLADLTSHPEPARLRMYGPPLQFPLPQPAGEHHHRHRTAGPVGRAATSPSG